MTEAEKALDRLSNETNFVEAETIRKALQGVAKSQGLLKCLNFIATSPCTNCNTHTRAAIEAINNFNSDETGVGS